VTAPGVRPHGRSPRPGELTVGARDALRLVAALGDFQSRMTRDQDAATILGATRLLLHRLLPFSGLVFMTVNEDTSDFEIALCDPADLAAALQAEIDACIDDGTFAWALEQRRAVMVAARRPGHTLVLHPLLTRSRVVGMFVGALEGSEPRVTEVLLNVFSVVLFSTAQALENAALYATMRATMVSKELLEAANADLRQEIIERRRAEDALRLEEERHRALFDNASDVIYTHDLDGRFASLNPAAERVLGFAPGEAVGHDVLAVIAPEHADRMRGLIAATLQSDTAAVAEMDAVSRGGQRVTLEVSARAIVRDGRPVGVQGIARDLSERRRLEAQLAQSQKMEAIGRLAGGVAHDFNNLLMVILGYADLMLLRLEEDAPGREQVEQMRKAAESAASLTRQLLAFSRRQVLQPRALDLNAIVGGLGPMLRRLIGEDIELVIQPEATREAEADPAQVEQVIVNLAVNARDAMPTGGRLVMGTADVERDGSGWVMLSVSDTGQGMDAATAGRIFEPFFTTKELSKGTGLGLSMVYGIVQQHRGLIDVDTAPGCGATFRVYLPRASGPASAATVVTRARPALGGTETILLVEDEPAVRALVRDILTGYGYTVLEAASGAEALAFFEGDGSRIDLLLTDVVMPSMSGKTLAGRLTAARPDLDVLFMSGYTDDVIGRHGVLDSKLAYIQKPFTPEQLARKVRDVLAA
jgi:PAS domain S-box-containing protein